MIRILHRRETAAKPGWGIVFYRACGALSVFAPCHGLLGFNSMRSCRCSWRYRKPAANHAKYARERGQTRITPAREGPVQRLTTDTCGHSDISEHA